MAVAFPLGGFAAVRAFFQPGGRGDFGAPAGAAMGGVDQKVFSHEPLRDHVCSVSPGLIIDYSGGRCHCSGVISLFVSNS